MTKWLKAVAFVAAFVAVCLGGLEAWLRWSGFTPNGYYIARYYGGVPGDLEPGLVMNEALFPERKYRISSTPQGTRGLKPFSPEKPGSTIRVLCLGDSFTFSSGVDDSETYPEQLARELERRYPGRRIEVVNAGMPMFGLLDEIDYYLEKGRALRPDLVILQFYSNDFQDHLRGYVLREVQRKFSRFADRPWLSRHFGWSRVYQWHAATYPQRIGVNHMTQGVSRTLEPCEGFDPVLDPFRFCPEPEETGFLKDRDRLLGQANDPAFSRVTGAYFKSLGLFRDILAADGVPLLLVSIPDRWQVGGYRNAVSTVMSRGTSLLGVYAIDMTSAFRESQFRGGLNPYMTNGDDHCSSWGNLLLARAVADALRISDNQQDDPKVALLPAPPLFDFHDPAWVRLWVDKNELLRPEGPVGVRLRVDKAVNAGVEEETSVAINALHSLTKEGEPGEIVLRIDAPFPMKRLDVRLPRKVANDPTGTAAVTTWVSGDNATWRLVDDSRLDKAYASASYEQFSIAEIPFEESHPSTVWLKIRMSGNAVVYSERPGVPKIVRSFDLYLYRAKASASSP